MAPLEEQSGTKPTHIADTVSGGGSAIEAAGGIAAVALAIVGLAGVAPVYMVAIAAVVIGASLLMEGSATAARFSRSLAQTPEAVETEVGGGVATEFLGGVAGLILGILALLGLAPEVLMPVAAIVFGGALLLAAGSTARSGSYAWTATTPAERASRIVAREAASSAAATQAVIGVASVVLGILAVVQIQPLVLTLVAMLALGAGILLSGAALSARVATGIFGRA